MNPNPTQVVWRRIFAYMFDTLVIEGVAVVLFLLTAGVRERPELPNCDFAATSELCSVVEVNGTDRVYTANGWSLAVAIAVVLGLGILIRVIMQGATGTTPGMSIFGIRCVNAEGEKCGVGRAFVRWVMLIIDLISCVLPVGLWVMMFTKDHRRLGDFAAGTYVVRKDAMGAPLDLAMVTAAGGAVAAPPSVPGGYAPPPGGYAPPPGGNAPPVTPAPAPPAPTAWEQPAAPAAPPAPPAPAPPAPAPTAWEAPKAPDDDTPPPPGPPPAP